MRGKKDELGVMVEMKPIGPLDLKRGRRYFVVNEAYLREGRRKSVEEALEKVRLDRMMDMEKGESRIMGSYCYQVPDTAWTKGYNQAAADLNAKIEHVKKGNL